MELAPTSNGCLPWAEAYGFYAGDGASKDVEVTVTESTSDVLSPLQNYIVGSGVFTHAYASPDNEGEAWVAHFSGEGRDSNLANNAGGSESRRRSRSARARGRPQPLHPDRPHPQDLGHGSPVQILAYDLRLDRADRQGRHGGGVRRCLRLRGPETLSAPISGKDGWDRVAASTGLVTFDTDSKAAGFTAKS